jgi:rod shape-determining protein MreC
MNPKKISSRLHTIIKSAVVAAILPFIVIYLIVAKPDYRLMNGFAHFMVPIANGVGDFITWPLRAGGKIFKKINDISNLEQENEELRAMLQDALSKNQNCDVAILENQKLAQELDVKRNLNFENIVADVILDNSALNHETFMINRGYNDGIEPGMVVISFENTLIGTIIDSGKDFSRVRALTDSNTNIAVRIAGSEVYGFVHGNGSKTPNIGFFSDPKFQPSSGIKVLTSNISGMLPSDIFVGTMINESDVGITEPGKVSRVMVLKFNTDQGKYK